MNNRLKLKAKSNFEKDFLKLINNALLEKLWKILQKQRNIKPVTTKKRRNHLVSEPNYYTTKFFKENVSTIEMRKTQILINKPVYLGLLILDLSENVMFDTSNFEIDRPLP